MRARLFFLLLVTIVSGVIAGFVGNATAGKPRSAAVARSVGNTFVAGRCPRRVHGLQLVREVDFLGPQAEFAFDVV